MRKCTLPLGWPICVSSITKPLSNFLMLGRVSLIGIAASVGTTPVHTHAGISRLQSFNAPNIDAMATVNREYKTADSPTIWDTKAYLAGCQPSPQPQLPASPCHFGYPHWARGARWRALTHHCHSCPSLPSCLLPPVAPLAPPAGVYWSILSDQGYVRQFAMYAVEPR